VDPVTDAEVWARAMGGAKRLTRRESPTTEAAANRRRFGLEWPLVTGFSHIAFLHEP
jgi:hypothetical protein